MAKDDHYSMYRARIQELLTEVAPEGAYTFVNGPYEEQPKWRAGWVDNPADPDECRTYTGKRAYKIVFQLKKELRNRKYNNNA